MLQQQKSASLVRLTSVICASILLTSTFSYGILPVSGQENIQLESANVTMLQRPAPDRILVKVLALIEPIFALRVDLDGEILDYRVPRGWSASVEGGRITFSTDERPIPPSHTYVFKIKASMPVTRLNWQAFNENFRTVDLGITGLPDSDLHSTEVPPENSENTSGGYIPGTKRIVASTTWFRANICGVEATNPENLARIGIANLDSSKDFVSSFNPRILSLARANGFETIAADGHSVSELKGFLAGHPPNEYPATYLSFDMTLLDYSSSDVEKASALIREAGYKVAISGPSAKPFIREAAGVADLFIYEAQGTLLMKGEDQFLSNVRAAAREAKSVNQELIFLVFLPIRSTFNCEYTVERALSTVGSITDYPSVDGIVLFNFKDEQELLSIMRYLAR